MKKTPLNYQLSSLAIFSVVALCFLMLFVTQISYTYQASAATSTEQAKEACKNEKAGKVRDACQRGYRGQLDGETVKVACKNMSAVNETMCEAAYKLAAKNPKTTESSTAAATTKEEACKNSRDKPSCEKGYQGQKDGKTEAGVCGGLTGSKKNICESGYQKAKESAGGVVDQSNIGPVSQIDHSSLPQVTAEKERLDLFANIAFGIAGSLALLFVAIGGVRYIMSQGDPNNVSRAKNTILYALIGLVVTISAFAIVKFVLARIV